MRRRSGGKPNEVVLRRTLTRLDVFERSLQKAAAWLDELMTRLDWEDRHQTYEALGVVLHALRDRLPLRVAVSLGAQLPLLLRGLYYQNWEAPGVPEKYRHVRDFLGRVRAGLREHRLDVLPEDRLVRGVLELLRSHLSLGELNEVRRALPPDLRSLFDATGSPKSATWLPEERAWDKFLM
jgi:uncharacterized protein (DUF2267 family)